MQTEGNILGTTGLASGWSEWINSIGPSEPLASRIHPLNKTAAWDLTVKWPFTDSQKKGVLQTSTTSLVAKALTTRL